MSITNYADGLASFGVPLPSSGYSRANGQPHLFVQAEYGNNGFPGTDPGQPLRTMARALQLVRSGGTIHVIGSIREQLTAPAGIFDVTIIGEGNRPRHADAHTSSTLALLGGRSGATWKAPASPVATTPLFVVRQQGWRFVNMLFAPPSDDAALEFIRDAASGDSERDSSHAEVLGCRFAGGQDHILITGSENIYNVRLAGNVFNDATGTSIKSANKYANRWIIENNVFEANANHIVAGMDGAIIWRNMFGRFTTKSIDLSPGTGDYNKVTMNYLSGTYSVGGGYIVGGGNDEWAGNWNTLAGGITVADPA